MPDLTPERIAERLRDGIDCTADEQATAADVLEALAARVAELEADAFDVFVRSMRNPMGMHDTIMRLARALTAAEAAAGEG